MSEGDFEVMPRGTMKELQVLREFVKNMTNVLHSTDNPTLKWDQTRPLVLNLEQFYQDHNEKYPL